MEKEILSLLIGIIVGFGSLLFIVLIVALVKHKITVKQTKDKELITKAIGLLMSETNGNFTSYRLGDISFPEFESKVRNLVEQLNAEVNEHLAVLDSSYVSILGRYAEDKSESLLAIREALSGQPSMNISQQNFAPAQVPQQQVQQPQAVAPGNEFSDFAASMEQNASQSDALFGGGEQTIVQDTIQNQNQNQFAAAEQTIVAHTTPSFAQPSQAAPQQQFQQQVPQQVPQQQFQPAQEQSASGQLDVEATQEFNVNDIMNHSSATQQSDQNNMVSVDDIANKLDTLFG